MFKEEKVPSDQPVKAKRFYGTYVAGTSMLIYFFTNGMALFIPPNLFPRLMEEFQAELERKMAEGAANSEDLA